MQESRENKNVDSSQSSLKNTSLIRDTVVRKIIIKICVKYSTSGRGNLELKEPPRLSFMVLGVENKVSYASARILLIFRLTHF